MRQLVSGNPGTSYIACLLFAIEKAHSITIAENDQLDIFCKSVQTNNSIFFTSALSLIANVYNTSISVYCSSLQFAKRAAKESLSTRVQYQNIALTDDVLLKLLRAGPIVMSVDLHCFGYGYHDYHFCYVFGEHDGIYVFEPKSGTVFPATTHQVVSYFRSTKTGLADIALVFTIQ